MSDKPTMDPQSDADKAVLKALGGLADDIKKGTDATTDPIVKGDTDVGDGNEMKPEGQGKADGGQKEDLKKNEDKDEDDEKEEDDEKGFSDSDLVKALDSAIAVMGGADPSIVERRAELAEKLVKGGLDKDESEELRGMLASDDEDDSTEDLQRSYAAMATDDPDISGEGDPADESGAVDVSGFLQRFAAFLGGSLDTVASEISKGFQQESNSRMSLAKAMKAIGMVVLEERKMLKSLADRMDVIEGQTPGRRSARTVKDADHLQRSFGTDGGGDMGLTKGDLVKGLMQLANDPKLPEQQRDAYAMACTRVECNQSPGDQIINDVKKALGR